MRNLLLKIKSSYDHLFKIQFRVLVSLAPLVNFLLFTPVLCDPKYKSALFLFLPSMARTKNSVQRRTAGIPAKSPRAPSSRDSGPAEPRPHRYRPGTRARMEIRKWRYREPERLLIRRLPFARLVREIAEDFMAAPRFKPQAIEALHYAAESYLVKMFEDANLLARHAKRITVYNTDIKLVQRIRGDN